MTPDRWLQVKEIFHAATELEPQERRTFLLERCKGDREMLRELELLIESHEEAEHFIERPALAPASALLSKDEQSVWVGRIIGQYRVLSEIGRGGMGQVLLAVRADDQFKKRVAIKVLRRGMDTEDILRRFRNERQILASLEHPNIARLLDGGATDGGLPYFVLEHIEGEPLDMYCDKHTLSTEERLVLFRKICGAVEFAHQNLVIHRDLKPSNILITSEGEPKLLDFGIAKLLNPELAAQTLSETEADLRLMTPEYASPEQIRGEKLTTSTDVYSLGVILYKLLTGQPPYQTKDTTPEELLRAMESGEPEKPSKATGSGQANSRRPSGDNGGGVQPASPIRNRKVLRGDLDNIILMALRKEPARRYRSVEQFSEDIRRHLEGLPVIARKDTFVYRASKFVGRNKVTVVAACLIALAIIAGLLVALWQAENARCQRDLAQRERLKAEPLLRSALKTFQETLGERHPTTVNCMRDLANLLNYQQKFDESILLLQKAVEIYGGLQPEHTRDLANAKYSLAQAYYFKSDPASAELIYRELLDFARRNYGNKDDLVAETANDLANIVRNKDYEGAIALYREAIEIIRPQPDKRMNLATFLANISNPLIDVGRYDEAETALLESLAIRRELFGEQSPSLAIVLTRLSRVRFYKGGYARAEAEARAAVGIQEQALPQGHRNFALDYVVLGRALTRNGKLKEAEKYLRDGLELYVKRLGADLRGQAIAEISLGECLIAQQRYAEAEPLLTRAYESLNASLGTQDQTTIKARQRLVALYENWKKPDKAAEYRSKL
jgi:serine/threonine protein kinase/tetratricopeptide (TPR) repeat protein